MELKPIKQNLHPITEDEFKGLADENLTIKQVSLGKVINQVIELTEKYNTLLAEFDKIRAEQNAIHGADTLLGEIKRG